MNKWTKKERTNGQKKKLALDTYRQTDREMNERTIRTDSLTYEQTARQMDERNKRMEEKINWFLVGQDERQTVDAMDGWKNPSDWVSWWQDGADSNVEKITQVYIHAKVHIFPTIVKCLKPPKLRMFQNWFHNFTQLRRTFQDLQNISVQCKQCKLFQTSLLAVLIWICQNYPLPSLSL